jgi:hypothetical protein
VAQRYEGVNQYTRKWEWPNAAFVEIKAEGDRYSKLQEREVHRMQHDGIPVFTARDLTDIEAIVEIVRHGKR